MSSSSKYYFPQLDAIRGLSVLAVYFFHAFHPDLEASFLNGLVVFLHSYLFLGLDVFFILSAFLLTWLGINVYKLNGNFSFRNYFIRRALRIWPLYFLLMIFSFIIVPYAASYYNTSITLPPAYYYLFFISNFYLEGHVYFLRFLWTLSVEEQFYLLWGLCLLLFQERIITCALILGIISIAYTVYAILNGLDTYYHTLVYLFDFVVGIIAAVMLHRENRMIGVFRGMSPQRNLLFFLVLPLIFFVMYCWMYNAPAFVEPWINMTTRYLFIIYMGFFILEQMTNKQTLLTLKASRFLVYTGKISYGLYCFHGIVLTFGWLALQKTGIEMPVYLRVIIFLIINYMISAISYQFVERPFLLLKNKLRRI